jgi:hypothetical protein
MPAQDGCQQSIAHAMAKAGWIVHTKPYAIHIAGRRNPLLIDLQATKEGVSILLEVKCFQEDVLNELYVAIGQYMTYRSLLNRLSIHKALYLAIPLKAYQSIFQSIGKSVVNEAQMKLLIVDLEQEEVIQWINS